MLETSFHLIGNLTNIHHDAFTRFMESINPKLNKSIVIYINSAGGDSNVATSIYLKIRKLKSKGVQITTIGDMNIKSGAFLIYLAGDTRLSYIDCTFMYHHHFKPINIQIKLQSTSELEELIAKEDWYEQAKVIERNNKKMDNEISAITGIDIKQLRKLDSVNFDAIKALNLNVVNKLIEE